MIQKHEIEEFIQSLNGQVGQVDDDGNVHVYKAEVIKNEDGDLIFKFVEDGDSTPGYYKINVEFIGHEYEEK